MNLKFYKITFSFFIFLTVSCNSPSIENNCLLLSTEFRKPCLANESRLYRRHNKKAVDYFMEIGFGAEYFDFGPTIVKKWLSPIHIKIYEDYKQSDIEEIEKITEELSQLTNLVFRTDNPTPNMHIYFTLKEELPFRHRFVASILPGPLPIGFFYVNDTKGVIYEAVILINREKKGTSRLSLLREEITQSLGLMKDSHVYPKSIFHHNSAPLKYTEVDKQVIRLLYDEIVEPGMTRKEVLDTLWNLPD